MKLEGRRGGRFSSSEIIRVADRPVRVLEPLLGPLLEPLLGPLVFLLEQRLAGVVNVNGLVKGMIKRRVRRVASNIDRYR